MDTHCTICLDDFEQATMVPCNHVFCFACITEWSRINNKCPMCRKVLDSRFMHDLWRKVNID
jgi:predicted amidophosphoribosyltransferase